MPCDGRYLRAAAYPELYAVLGGLYGERSSTADLEFRIPDYRGCSCAASMPVPVWTLTRNDG
ncbi:phage tail protein [Rhizobium beringeri]